MTEEITEIRKHKYTGELVYQIDDEEWFCLDQVYREQIPEEVAKEDANELIFKKEADSHG